MKKIIALIFCLMIITGCQSVSKKIEDIEVAFANKEYQLFFGTEGVTLRGSVGNSLVATIVNDDVIYITYINIYTKGGVKIYKDGKYQFLTEKKEYYNEYKELLKEVDISERGLFNFFAWEYADFKDEYLTSDMLHRYVDNNGLKLEDDLTY